MALSASVVLLAWGTGFDWTTVVSVTVAAKIVGAIGVIKMVYNFFAPAANVPVITTDNPLVPHVAVK